MTRPNPTILAVVLAAAGAAVLSLWLFSDSTSGFVRREPGMDVRPDPADLAGPAKIEGLTTPGEGTPGSAGGSWPGFRGPNADGVCPDPGRLAESWPAGGPPKRWSVDLGEGHAGAAIHRGRVYVFDYDQETGADAIRCLSFDDGREIWRFAYPLKVKRNHGMSRTVPAVTDRYVVGLGPKCHVSCLDAETGKEKWTLDLVRKYGTTVPQWYAGQCPIIDGDRVILAPCGPELLMTALKISDGSVAWTTPNPRGWKMTHASLARVEVDGVSMWICCGSRGVAGVSAEDGKLLWDTTEWKIGIATVPTPVPVGDGRVFFSGGYNAGSVMMRIERDEAGTFTPKVLFRLGPEVFGATQQTPILHKGHLYGVRPNGELTCLDLDGEVLWTSGPKITFGIAPFLIAGDLIYVLDDDGLLSLVRAVPDRFERLAEAKVLGGPDAWGPMAMASGCLIVRDLKKMTCLEVDAP